MLVTVYNTDSIKARDILAQVKDDDILTETIECTGKVHIEQCFFDSKRRFDKGLSDLELRIIGSVKDLFIESYEDRQFPCNSKQISFMDAEPVMIDYFLTAEEMGLLYSKGVNHPGFEPPANMKYNTMEIPMLIEYKGIYESPVCFARIIRPNEIHTSTKKCGYYGLFDLAAEHPDVTAEKQNGGIDINLTKSSPELVMEVHGKSLADMHEPAADRKAMPVAKPEVNPEDRIVANVKEKIAEHTAETPVAAEASDETVKVYHESVAEYTEKSNPKDATNVSDIDVDGNVMPDHPDNVIPYTVRQMNSGLYGILSQKVEEHAEKAALGKDKADSMTDKDSDEEGFGQEDKSLSKSEREARRQIKLARKADIAADNKALNADAHADISGQGASEKKTSAQELLNGVMGSKPASGDHQFL